MNTTLVILAAGLGSRFGSDKQLEEIHNGNALFDYGIYDAIEAGFSDVVLIIRTQIEELTKKHLENRFKGLPVSFVYQDLQNPEGIVRQKPWGTGHAMLCVKDVVKNPFLIMNADDYYGKDAFSYMVKALKSGKEKTFYSAGYLLKNTLSENGTVSRGVCNVNENNHLQSIVEATKLRKIDENMAIDEETGEKYPLGTFVSMNFWGFTPEIFPMAQKLFAEFVEANKENPKAEFFIPLVVQHAIEKEGYTLEVLPNNDAWFGMTYREDLLKVREEIKNLTVAGGYPENF
ncbi:MULTISPECIES: nucleotidyltransferase family protein [Capnocytophaga]|uniref:Nucleotidyltransferase n=1 Tax=Capnocytophaga canis TaxID=1848903 RepID=A0A0B7IQ70_9FLAO|nr:MULTISPECIES: sugar phosphate nucleotidyltransferase [Capnocytophaga]ATA72396.1 nucleotidyltransferase [Capnocytophaga sp. H4358]ATA74504.1 nucleotidyltransferase [Capnocytophaga sp. H2931]RIY35811.1 nucleotidyltransferase [Capnocytophaga canis]CEN43010.1 putative Conserved Glucosamine-1-phosphate N-acetyltransferase [Capnocytophaga canis]CEN47251.1 putative Conserved Glucosamine-1-phosphate N-acetyltransferase [Capnocytophaga canis]